MGALRWLVPKGLHVMRGPLGLAKITRHVLVEVSWTGESLRTHSRSGLALSRRHQGHLYRGRRGPSEMGVNVDVFRLWRLLLVMLGEAGWWGAHHPWRWLHLRPHWWGAVRHVRGYEWLEGLLGQGAPVVLERRGSSRT